MPAADTRRDLCYSQYRDGQCLNPTAMPVTKSSCCCCTVITGQPMGWGTPCQPCPPQDSSEFQTLCPHGAGMTFNGDGMSCSSACSLCICITVLAVSWLHEPFLQEYMQCSTVQHHKTHTHTHRNKGRTCFWFHCAHTHTHTYIYIFTYQGYLQDDRV